MKKDLHLFKSKSNVSFSKIILPALLLLFSSINAWAWQGNGTMVCNDNIQVSLDYYCEAEITPDMMLEGNNYGSWDNYAVSISNVVGTIVTKPGFHTVTVTNTVTNNSCWGTISVEDKLPPLIDYCPCALGNNDPQCHFYCSDLEGIQNGTIPVPTPEVYENCSSYFTQTSDQIIEGGCGQKTLKRTYVYTDESGNKSIPCVSYYELDPIILSDVTQPVAQVQLTCGSDASPNGVYNYFKATLPSTLAYTYAYPTINGKPVKPGTAACNILTTFTDTETMVCGAGCPNSKKVLRSWLVLNWCTGESKSFLQIIKATDNQAPTIIADDITTSVDPWGCTANVEFPAPITLHDNCSSTVEYDVVGAPLGIEIVYRNATNTYVALNVPKGIHTFTYRATDCCGNIGTDVVTVQVVDKTSPVAISKQFVVVSLTKGAPGQGIAKVYAESIDNGSHDGCTAVHLEIRRDEDLCGIQGNSTYNADGHSFDGSSNINASNYDPDNGAYVKFCCADLTDIENGVPFGIVKVWLRVWDDGDMDGKFGSAGDNYNETWSYVRVEDKLPPTIVCPHDITINCEDDYTDLYITGKATGGYTCTGSDVEHSDLVQLNSCGAGTVYRKWWVKGSPNTYCTQKITVRSGQLFNPNTIVYPANITTDCKNFDSDAHPTWISPPCSLIGYSLQSDTFKFEDGACFKIINKFTVVDWCVYEPNTPNSGGIWYGTQIIKVIDNTAPEISCTDAMYEVNDNNDADGDGIKCELRGLKLSNTAVDNGDCASKWLKWVITVDLWGDGTSDYEYSSFLPSTDNSFNDSNLNGIPDKYISPTSSGQMVMIEIPVDIPGSMSNHKVQWKVTDGCGNVTSCTQLFMVVDKKKPTPYCMSVSTALMQNGQIELWARDFDVNSFDNCTAKADLVFTFDEEHPVWSKINQEHYFKGQGLNATAAEYNAGEAQRWLPASNSSARIFNCDDLPKVDVKMSVWDEKQNTDYCVVQLTLVDNQDACGAGNKMNIAGKVMTEDAKPLANVSMGLKNMSFSSEVEKMTSADGDYAFSNVIPHFDYQLVPTKDDNYLNGISTLDLVLMQRHILNSTKLNSPYKIIAADINNDQRITAADLVELRKLILGTIDKYSNNHSWRFISDKTVFGDLTKPWPFLETVSMQDLSNNMSENFTACKIGDVNSTASNLLGNQNTENRSKETAIFSTPQLMMESGNIYIIPFESDNVLSGYQLSIKGLGLEFIEAYGPEFYTSNYSIQDNVLNMSWNEGQNPSGKAVINLVVKATSPGFASDKLVIEENGLKAEAYGTTDLEVKDLKLRYIDATNEGNLNYTLLQNEPNPFKGKTKISFIIPNDADATLTIFDVTGKVLFKHSDSYQKGMNTIDINTAEFGVNGLMYYQIESGSFSETKKMIDLK